PGASPDVSNCTVGLDSLAFTSCPPFVCQLYFRAVPERSSTFAVTCTRSPAITDERSAGQDIVGAGGLGLGSTRTGAEQLAVLPAPSSPAKESVYFPGATPSESQRAYGLLPLVILPPFAVHVYMRGCPHASVAVAVVCTAGFEPSTTADLSAEQEAERTSGSRSFSGQ